MAAPDKKIAPDTFMLLISSVRTTLTLQASPASSQIVMHRLNPNIEQTIRLLSMMIRHTGRHKNLIR